MEMEQIGFSTLMFIFSALLLLYALILALTKDISMIPRAESVKIRDKKEYPGRFAKVIAATALAPLTSGLIARNGHMLWAMVMLAAGFVICIREGIKFMGQDKTEKTDETDDPSGS